MWGNTYGHRPGFQQEGEGSVSSELNIGPSNNHADSSMVDDSLRELAMNLQKSSIYLKVGHLNVRSLRSKIDELRLLQELCKFVILAITESNLDTADSG